MQVPSVLRYSLISAMLFSWIPLGLREYNVSIMMENLLEIYLKYTTCSPRKTLFQPQGTETFSGVLWGGGQV